MSLSQRLEQAARERQARAAHPSSLEPMTPPAQRKIELASLELIDGCADDAEVVRFVAPLPEHRPLAEHLEQLGALSARWERPVVERIDHHLHVVPAADDLIDLTEAETEPADTREAQLASLYEIIAAERRNRGLTDPEPAQTAGGLPRRTPTVRLRFADAEPTPAVAGPQLFARPAADVATAGAAAPATTERASIPPRPTLGMRRLRAKSQGRTVPVHECPGCGAAARVDIHDPFRGRMHLSCPSCYRMWQEEFTPVGHDDESALMRD